MTCSISSQIDRYIFKICKILSITLEHENVGALTHTLKSPLRFFLHGYMTYMTYKIVLVCWLFG